jgi:hypothetical protein
LVLLLLAAWRPAVRAEAAAAVSPGAGQQAAVLAPLESLVGLPNAEVAPLFAKRVRPLLATYCLACHSVKEKKGELDLERFASIDVARTDLKPWQSVVEMLDAGEMPPKGRRQPTDAERKWLIDWTRRWLDLEARARAGDPGRVALRRLSNAEYNCTVRDLTGVDLQPAREFPADGAAGEGFTNAAEALSMSSALVDKYLAAAKSIADHAVMLPDGFRFSPSSHQHDWIDESLLALHQFYDQFIEADGRIPLRRYLAATLRYRIEFAAGTKSFAEVARQDHLSAKYLEILWHALADSRPSLVLDDIRKHWKSAGVGDAGAIAERIERWQKTAWTLSDKAACIYEPYQTPRRVVNDTQEFRIKLRPPPARNGNSPQEIMLYLSARTVAAAEPDGKSDSGVQPLVIWDKARFEADRQPPLALRDVAAVAEAMDGALGEMFGDTSEYLAAAAEWHDGGPADSVESIAKKNSLDAKRLQRWIDVAGVSRDAPGPLELLEVKMPGRTEPPSVSGWGSKTPDTLPILLSNSADRTVNVPGRIPGHKVVVHPSPDEYVAVAWRSPLEGRVRIEAIVADAHAGCGNGVAWWLDTQHATQRQKLVGGEFDDGKAATIQPLETQVRSDDIICLAVAAREHNHFCDTTLVDLTITELDGKHRTWNLSADIADNVLDGNPHADRQGNKNVWRFCKGRDNSPRAPQMQLAADSILAKWRDSLDRPNSRTERTRLAEQVRKLLTGPAPAADGKPDSLLFAALVSPASPLVDAGKLNSLLEKRKGASSASATAYGIDPSRWGTGRKGSKSIPESAFTTESPSVLKIRLPARLVANREFIVEAKLDPASAGNRLVQAQALAEPPAGAEGLAPAPILCSQQGNGRETGAQASDEFRRVFPAALCFGRIVPEDSDGITLCMYCREDEPLSRLMLEPSQQQRLEQLWLELKYVGRQAQKENESFPLFMGFASQVGLVPKFEPMREPLRARAAAFQREMEASEAKHLDLLVDFAARAYRRPLSGQERTELLSLYQSLRKKKNVSHEDAMRGVLARVLIAPAFLFHLETAPPGKEPKPVDDWNLASRLSYFLWSSMPDETLRQVAASGQLHDPRILAEQTLRMLKSPQVRSLAIEFGTQWIHVRGFDDLKEKNERLFPMFDASLRSAIYEESILFFQDLFQNDRPLERILDADYTYLNETLAKHYGIPGVSGQQWRLVDGVQKYGRGGILGLASVQAAESGASRTSPTLRGNWVSETLLGEKLPRPPPNVPKLREEESGSDGLSVRQLVEQHARVAECAVCHRRIDPLGFALEHYDAIGRFRDKDSGGVSIDCHAKLKDGSEFEGIDGLRHYLLTKKRDVVMRLFCRRLLGYALGRETSPSDAPVIDAMIEAINKNDGRISAAMLQIVASPQFRLIRGSEED